MEKKAAPLNVRKNLRRAFFHSLLVPVLVLAFFIAAPHWLNSKLRTEIAEAVNRNPDLSPEERDERLEKISATDYETICLDCPPGKEATHDRLARAGVVGNFEHLRWGLILSLVLVVGLALAVTAIFVLNTRARRSRDDLIRAYQLSWKIGMAAALAKVFLLIPLLAYGTFEFTVLLSNQYFPKLLLVIIVGGLFALWKSAAILLKKIPLEFKEPMSREVSPTDAPELWRAVRYAAQRLQTTPPDRIIIGLKFNFYVTELAVQHDAGRAEGKTLFLSYPLLKQLSEDEVVAIIGHELGHFIGEDTRMTREFYPMRMKVRETMIAMVRSGWIGWPSSQFLNFFTLCFGETEQAASRQRELLADQKAAVLTSPRIMAGALVRFQVAAEAFQRGLKEAVKNRTQNLLDIPLQTIVQEKLAPEEAFWTQLFEKKLPHPLDSHPPLHVRLEALGQPVSAAEAQAIALATSESAFDKWFPNHDALFAGLSKQAAEAMAKLRSRTEVTEADYKTEAGKQLLDQHFPEQTWPGRPASVWLLVVLLGILFAGCVAGAIFVGDPIARMIFGFVGLLFATAITLTCKRHYKARLILNADGVHYTGWTRPLQFAQVKNISARRSHSSLTLTFHLKAKQRPIWKFALLRLPTKSTSLTLNTLQGKPVITAQTIVNYFTRQIGPG